MHTRINPNHHRDSTSNETAAAPAAKPLDPRIFRTKKCRTCAEERPLSAFYRQQSGRQRYRPHCIRCLRLAERARKKKERDEHCSRRRCRNCRRSQPIGEFAVDLRCRGGHTFTCRTCEAHRLDRIQREQREGLDVPDHLLRRGTPLAEERVDLGIAIAHATCPAGYSRSREEIAAYSGLSLEAVRRIELRALAKMRKRARQILEELGLANFLEGGQP